VMVGRRTTHERKGAQAARADEHRILFAAVAVSIFALSAASAEAQQSPTLPSLPAGGESVAPSESLPDIARVPGGWTADAVGARARKTSFDIAAREASLRAAEARVAAAVVAFFPRLSGLGSYTRYQDLVQPSLGTLVEPTNPVPPGPIGPGTPLSAVPLTFTIPLNYWLFQATLTVPLSDYILRLSQQHGAASQNAEAARFDKLASEAKAYSDAKIAFYQYVKAVAQRDVLVQSMAVAAAHLQDAQNLFRVGSDSKADVLAADANVAAAQLAVEQATEMVGVAEEQLRLATHALPSEQVSIGEDVTTPLPLDPCDVAALKQEAATNRPEIQSLLLGAAAQDKLAAGARAAQWPSISAFGDYVYANPSPRIFIPEEQFHGYWDAGIRVNWAINDVFSGAAAGAEQQAHAAALRAQNGQILDAIFAEVTQTVLASRTADSSIASSGAQLRAAEEAYRARRELFRLGKGTSVELADAEANLFRARLAAVTARIDQRIARVRIDHATGRDVARRSS
jgi:outer membrane protein